MQILFDDKVVTDLSSYAFNLGKSIYVVGGVVRDLLMKKTAKDCLDIDLTGNLTYEEVKQFLANNKIKYEVKNRKLEVIGFKVGEERSYEYARLRKEEYLEKDTHTPSKVSFVDEVTEDAKRRDFTVNSVYYDRHSNSILDPVGGVCDIRTKTLNPVLGEDSFQVDPARIIRFIEVVARHELNVSDEIWDWAKKYAKDVELLSEARLRKECLRLFHEEKYENEKNEYLWRVNSIILKLNLQDKLKNDN